MNGKYFVDTNILVYAHDRSAGTKYQLARDLLERLWLEKQGVLSTQVLQEFCAAVLRKSPHPLDTQELEERLDDLLRWEVIVNSPAAALEALQLRKRYHLSFWDALILRAAAIAEAHVLYSEDMAHGQRYGNVRVVNPFV